MTMIGQRLGSYLIEEEIGSGAMGVVFRATNEKTGKTAAVKIITNGAGSKVNVPARFEREADILQQCKHPHIVRWLAVGRYQGTNYFAMEYLTGGTLEDIIEKQGPLSWRQTIEYAAQICDALHYAHQRNIIHRDLKPSNLLLSAKGTLKLTDFGIAKDLDAEALTATGRTLGTAAYMAPEQIRGEPPISHKTDLYALGCLMYQMLAGDVPFKGSSPVIVMNQHLTAKIPRASLKSANLPRALDDLIYNLMSKDVTKRPWDAEKVKADLEDLAARADRGEEIPMVFAGGDPARLGATVGDAPTARDTAPTPPSSPSRAPAPAATKPESNGSISPPTKPAKARKPRSSTFAAPIADAKAERLKTLGLAALLVITIVLIAYVLWPPSAATLYAKAETLMKSEKPADWMTADREYLVELDRRFPNLYVEQKQAWRDKLGLEEKRRRAAVLEKPNLGRLSEPKGETEANFVSVFNDAAGALKAGDDEEAALRWREMADLLAKSKDAADRPWRLLAKEREQEVLANVAKRREAVIVLLDRADRLITQGKPDESDKVRRDIVKRYGHIKDLKGLIRGRTGIDPDAKPDTKDKDAKDKDSEAPPTADQN